MAPREIVFGNDLECQMTSRRGERLPLRTAAVTGLALLCFAANSLLCRAALRGGRIDAATFTTVRLTSGAVVLALITLLARAPLRGRGNVASGFALFAYAAAFSFAYLRIGAGVGALLLFGAVQVTMLGWSVARGGRPGPLQWLGVAIALVGPGMPTLSLPSPFQREGNTSGAAHRLRPQVGAQQLGHAPGLRGAATAG